MVDEAAIICDLSGSMMECGKRFIMGTVLRSVDQYSQMLNPNADLRLFALRDGLEELDWKSGDKTPDELMRCSGSANIGALPDEFGNDPDTSLIILSDGYWDDSQERFAEWASHVQANCLRVILIGADANTKLKAEYVYAAENLLAALENLGD